MKVVYYSNNNRKSQMELCFRNTFPPVRDVNRLYIKFCALDQTDGALVNNKLLSFLAKIERS